MMLKHRLWLHGVKIVGVLAAGSTALASNARDGVDIDTGAQPDGKGIRAHEGHLEALRATPIDSSGCRWRPNRKNSFASSISSSRSSKLSIIPWMQYHGILRSFREGEGSEGPHESQHDGPSSNQRNMNTSQFPAPQARKAKTDEDLVVVNGCENEGLGTNTGKQGTNKGKKSRKEATTYYLQIQLTSALYLDTTNLFTDLVPHFRSSSALEDVFPDLLEDVGRLFLWGEAFSNGKLERVCGLSEELRSTIGELLATISKMLIESLMPCVVLSSRGDEIRSRADSLMKKSQKLEELEHAGSEEVIYDDDDSSEDYSYDAEDAVMLIRDSVTCLMRLLPSMERTLGVLHTELEEPETKS